MNNHIDLSNLENYIINNNISDFTHLKRYNLILFCSLINNLFYSGNIVEIGVGNGDTSAYLRNYFNNNFTCYMFDSYEGLSEPSNNDLLSSYHVKKGNMKCELDTIKSFMDIKCNNKNIKYIKGWVSDTIPNDLPNDICFAHIDLDLYEPMYHSIKHIIPKMKKNGLILIDDYDDPVWIGVKPVCDLIEKEFNVKITRINPPGSTLYQAILQVL